MFGDVSTAARRPHEGTSSRSSRYRLSRGSPWRRRPVRNPCKKARSYGQAMSGLTAKGLMFFFEQFPRATPRGNDSVCLHVEILLVNHSSWVLNTPTPSSSR